MADKGKYAGILSEIRQEQAQVTPPDAPALLVPIKPPAPAGKRSDPAYTQKGAFLKKETIRLANERLARRGVKPTFPTCCRRCWKHGLPPLNRPYKRSV